ncbi:MAG TPA: YiaA/YiaB family inner membrane protein [Cyanophyceae cyanobacterium]
MAKYDSNAPKHSDAWVIQVWLSFIISITATSIGIIYAPMDGWVKGYMGMGLLFSIGSSISLAKTTRDVYESKRLISRVDEAKLEKLLAEYDPFKKS